MATDLKTPTLRGQTLFWSAFPGAIAFTRKQRDAQAYIDYMPLRGVNAGLIVQCATFIDGLLAYALTVAIPDLDDRADDFYKRLAVEYYDRAHSANTYDANSKLFRVAMGRTLAELVGDALQETLACLFTFRNGLAHGRWIESRSYLDETTDSYSLEFVGNYKRVESYLLAKGLIERSLLEGGSGWSFLDSKVADHFCDFLSPFAYMIAESVAQGTLLKSVLDTAFTTPNVISHETAKGSRE
jgi:hypothetical protein